MIYRNVNEVVAKLGDKGFAEPYVTKVEKGQGRVFDVIEWHKVVGMLDEVFGPFGYDIQIVGSSSDTRLGIYTKDIQITGRAWDEDEGTVVTLVRSGTGVGIVQGNPEQAERHDMAAHGAKSDGITNASKSLGKGFGLYLYDKAQRTAGDTQSANKGTYTPKATAETIDLTDLMSRPVQMPAKDGYIGNVSPAQAPHARKKGWTDQALARLTSSEVRPVMDGVFGKGPVVEAPREPAAAF